MIKGYWCDFSEFPQENEGFGHFWDKSHKVTTIKPPTIKYRRVPYYTYITSQVFSAGKMSARIY